LYYYYHIPFFQSMYPGPKEFSIDNPESVAERITFIETECGNVASWVYFNINTSVDEVRTLYICY